MALRSLARSVRRRPISDSGSTGAGGVPASKRGLHGRVVEAAGAADRGSFEVHRRGGAVAIQVDGPQQGGADLALEQAGGALAERRGVQRGPQVR